MQPDTLTVYLCYCSLYHYSRWKLFNMLLETTVSSSMQNLQALFHSSSSLQTCSLPLTILTSQDVGHYCRLTEICSLLVSTPASYPGSPELKSRPREWLSLLRRLAAFLSLARQIPGQYSKFVTTTSSTSPLIIYSHSIVRRYDIWAIEQIRDKHCSRNH
jgi:hypothetical protein